jgi:hypothetical protein
VKAATHLALMKAECFVELMLSPRARINVSLMQFNSSNFLL